MHLLLDPGAWLLVLSILGSVGNLAVYQAGKRGVDAIRKRSSRVVIHLYCCLALSTFLWHNGLHREGA